MIGWILGDYAASCFVHQRLRHATERNGEVSFSGVLSSWSGTNYIWLQRITAVISLAFLLAYASAQLVAGSKALHVLLEWPMWSGAVLGALLVAGYCLAGGIRASIWTDAAQSIVMITAMAWILFAATQSFGGIHEALDEMRTVDGFLDLFPKDLPLTGLAGIILFVISWGFAGLSVIGQPHVMVRFMTLSNLENMRRARTWYYAWFICFYLMATSAGMLSRIYISDPGSFDAELALPTMAQELLSPIGAGVVLAGIFAATMSTADSLVLSCSAAVTHDLLPTNIENTKVLKLSTALITLLALTWALINKQSVFSLVIMAWSGLASSFAPLLIVLCCGGRPKGALSIIAIFTGLLTAMTWRFLGWHQYVYEGMAGIIAGLIVLVLGLRLSRTTFKRREDVIKHWPPSSAN